MIDLILVGKGYNVSPDKTPFANAWGAEFALAKCFGVTPYKIREMNDAHIRVFLNFLKAEEELNKGAN